MKRIDLHSHVIPEPTIAAMQAQPDIYRSRIVEEGGVRWFTRGKAKFELLPEFYDGHAKVEAMDRQKIDLAYISPGPQAFCYWLGASDAAQAARLTNDGIAAMVAQNPDRLRGMGTLPLQHPDLAIAELERIVREHGFKGVEVATNVQGEELAAPRFRPVLRRAEALKVLIFTHPENIGATGRLDCYYLTNLIGNPLDTTIMAANLMLSGALDELKTLKFLLPHAGGFLPADIGRFDWGYGCRPDVRTDTASPPMTLLRRFWFDALAHNPKAVRFLIDQVGADRVVLGTDSPFDMGDPHPVDNLERVPGLTADEREQISFRNAEALLGGTP